MTTFYQVARPGFGWLRHVPHAETAYHEAGHALIAAATRRRIAAATIEPQGVVVGSVTVAGAVSRADAPAPSDGALALGLIVEGAFVLGGPEAERLATGAVAGDERDRAKADWLLGEAGRLLAVPADWWRGLLSGAVEMNVRANWSGVEAVAAGLLDRGTLTGDQVHALLGDGVPPLHLSEVAAGIASLACVDVSSVAARQA